MAFLVFRLAHSFSHLHALFKPARALTEERRDSVSLGASLPWSRLSFQQTPKKRLQAKPKTPVIQGIPSGTQRATVQAWHLREKERDLKNRKRFGWTDANTAADWPHPGEHIEELKAQIKAGGQNVTLDLNEVSLADLD